MLIAGHSIFTGFSLKIKSIPYIHEMYTSGLVSFLPYSLTAIFHKCNKHTERSSCFGRRRGEEDMSE